jgi:hypothetical protein
LAHNTDRIVSIYVDTPKVAKASTIRVTVAGITAGIFTLTFADWKHGLMGEAIHGNLTLDGAVYS